MLHRPTPFQGVPRPALTLKPDPVPYPFRYPLHVDKLAISTLLPTKSTSKQFPDLILEKELMIQLVKIVRE
jgi:hypothetical protein